MRLCWWRRGRRRHVDDGGQQVATGLLVRQRQSEEAVRSAQATLRAAQSRRPDVEEVARELREIRDPFATAFHDAFRGRS